MSERQDIHAPSVIDPADYTLAEGPSAFHYYWNDWSKCAHCGHALKYAVRFDHVSGECIDVGQDCAILLDTDSRIAYEMTQLRKRVANERDRIAHENQATERREQMLKDAPDVVEFLELVNPNVESFDFVSQMVMAYDKYGSLTERQIEATRKVMAARQRYADQQLNEVEPTTPAPVGRQSVEGRVLSLKWKSSINYGDVLKMLVKLDDNNKVWGTVPSSINPEKGSRVSFTATFEQSDDDEHFSYFSRPAKATIL